MGQFRRSTGEKCNGYYVKTNIDILEPVSLNIDHSHMHQFFLFMPIHHGLRGTKRRLPFGFYLNED